MTSDVEGLAAFQASTADAISGLEDMTEAETAAGRIVQQRAAAGAPKATGVLAGSIRADVTDHEVAVSTSLVYGAVQEFGWPGHNIAAQPYMRPALADSESLVVEAYASQVRKEVGSIKGT